MDNLDGNEIELLQNGDKSILDRIYLKYRQRLYKNVLRITKDPVNAEDIVQEVFIILWENKMSLDPRKPLINWLYVVSHNEALDFIKSKKKLKFVEVNHWSKTNEEVGKRDQVLKREKQLLLIEEAINQLSPQRKRVMQLCKLQGQTYSYAARELCISKWTVKEYLSIAMRNIRDYVKTNKESEVEVSYANVPI